MSWIQITSASLSIFSRLCLAHGEFDVCVCVCESICALWINNCRTLKLRHIKRQFPNLSLSLCLSFLILLRFAFFCRYFYDFLLLDTSFFCHCFICVPEVFPVHYTKLTHKHTSRWIPMRADKRESQKQQLFCQTINTNDYCVLFFRIVSNCLISCVMHVCNAQTVNETENRNSKYCKNRHRPSKPIGNTFAFQMYLYWTYGFVTFTTT